MSMLTMAQRGTRGALMGNAKRGLPHMRRDPLEGWAERAERELHGLSRAILGEREWLKRGKALWNAHLATIRPASTAAIKRKAAQAA